MKPTTRRSVRRRIGIPIAVAVLGLAGVLAAGPASADEPPPVDLDGLTLDISKFPGLDLPPGKELVPIPPPPAPLPVSGNSGGESPGCAVQVTDPVNDNELIRTTIRADCPQPMDKIGFLIRIETLNMEDGHVSTWNDSDQRNGMAFPQTRSASYTLNADAYYKYAGCAHEYMRVRWNTHVAWAGRSYDQWDRTSWIPLGCGPEDAMSAADEADAMREAFRAGAAEAAGLEGLDGPRAN